MPVDLWQKMRDHPEELTVPTQVCRDQNANDGRGMGEDTRLTGGAANEPNHLTVDPQSWSNGKSLRCERPWIPFPTGKFPTKTAKSLFYPHAVSTGWMHVFQTEAN